MKIKKHDEFNLDLQKSSILDYADLFKFTRLVDFTKTLEEISSYQFRVIFSKFNKDYSELPFEKYTDEQCIQLYDGAKRRIDIMKYADFALPVEEMDVIRRRLLLERLIEKYDLNISIDAASVEAVQGSIDLNKLAILAKMMTANVEIRYLRKFTNLRLSHAETLKVIDYAIVEDFSNVDVSGMNFKQIKELYKGMKNGLDVSSYANKHIDATRMKIVRIALGQGKDISAYVHLPIKTLKEVAAWDEFSVFNNPDGCDPTTDQIMLERIAKGLGVSIINFCNPMRSQKTLNKILTHLVKVRECNREIHHTLYSAFSQAYSHEVVSLLCDLDDRIADPINICKFSWDDVDYLFGMELRDAQLVAVLSGYISGVNAKYYATDELTPSTMFAMSKLIMSIGELKAIAGAIKLESRTSIVKFVDDMFTIAIFLSIPIDKSEYLLGDLTVEECNLKLTRLINVILCNMPIPTAVQLESSDNIAKEEE